MRIAGVKAKEALEEIEVRVNEVSLEKKNADAETDEYSATAWDDVKGGKLNVEDVKKARAEEIGYMKQRGVWEAVPIGECWRRIGKGPIGIRCVDTNKGSADVPDVRCSLVARDLRGQACPGPRRSACGHAT